MTRNEANPLVSCIDTAMYGGGYVSASVPGRGVGAAEAVPTDPRFSWITGSLTDSTDDELYVVGVGCTPRFKWGGDTANAALHRAIDSAVGGKRHLHTLTKSQFADQAQVGNAYIVRLNPTATTQPSASLSSASAATATDTAEVRLPHFVIHVLGPNCNSEKQSYVQDVGEAARQLRASYSALFLSYGRVLQQYISQHSSSGLSTCKFFVALNLVSA
jgi:hypothetical protein